LLRYVTLRIDTYELTLHYGFLRYARVENTRYTQRYVAVSYVTRGWKTRVTLNVTLRFLTLREGGKQALNLTLH